ncbi:MAG: gliding motility-associated C-terminal domain-containing protein [Bacteroidota bacterium]
MILVSIGSLHAQKSFSENKGQWPSQVLYKCSFESADIYLEKDGFTFNTFSQEQYLEWAHEHGNSVNQIPIDAHAFQLKILNSSDQVEIYAKEQEAGYENYYLGNKASWAADILSYRRVIYEGIYPKIDIEVQKQEGQFKFNWIIKPGGKAEDISFNYLGTDRVKVKKGKLILQTQVQDFVEYMPLAYAEFNGNISPLKARYIKKGSDIGIEIISSYPKESTVVIDPVLVFSTYSGSTADNFGYTATFDSKGFLYAGSTVFGTGYPILMGAYDFFQGGTIDIGITKYDTTGTFRIYSTYLGGNNNEMPHSMIVNSNDELFVYGTTGSTNFPITDNAYQTANNLGTPPVLQSGLGFSYNQGQDIFISRFAADGTELIASTYIGGDGPDGLNLSGSLVNNYADEVRGEIEIDSNDNIYVATSTGSSNFPVSTNAFQSSLNGVQDGVIFKMDNNLTSLVWSTYFGMNGAEGFYSMDINSENEPIACGGTTSGSLPYSQDAYQQSYAGGTDGFLVHFNEMGNGIEGMTYLGFEEYDQIYFVEFDSNDQPYVFGQTETGDNFNFNNLYSNPNSGQFISKFSADLSQYEWGMCFGNGNGQPNISPTAFLVDFCNKIYLSGWGGDTGGGSLTTQNLPVSADAYQNTTDGHDFYLYVTGEDLFEPNYASYFGGASSHEHVDGGTSRFDKKGKVYQAVCAGCGGNDDFPFFPNDGVSSINGSANCNLGVFKVDFEEDLVIADFDVDAVCWPDPVLFENFSFNAENIEWLFGDNQSSSDINPSHLYAEPGIYEVSLIVNNPGSCNISDTLIKEILVLSPDGFELEDAILCESGSQIGIEPFGDASITYSWIPADNLSDPASPNPFFLGNSPQSYVLTINNGTCSSQATQNIEFVSLDLLASNDTVICTGDMLVLTAEGQGLAENFTWSNMPDFSSILSQQSALTTSPLGPTTYYVQSDFLTCTAVDSVNVIPAEFSTQISDGLYLCLNETGTLTAINLYPQYEIDYDWAPNEYILSGDGSPEIQINPSEDTEFIVNLSNSLGCTWQESIEVGVSDLDINNVSASASQNVITENESVTLTGIPGAPFDVSWSPTNGLSNPFGSNTEASPNSTTEYVYTVLDSSPLGDCIGTDTVTIQVQELVCGFPTVFIPNSFTPNGDGENDVLYVRGELVESMSLKIYDRWGEKIFESNDQNLGWNGTYKGREADSDVYVYVLEATCIDGQDLKDQGNITLIR